MDTNQTQAPPDERVRDRVIRLDHAPHVVVVAVALAAAAINALSFWASQLWVSPDASYYVELAGGIADKLDFHSELFLIRPPGYPLLLAAIFRLFGGGSPTAIMIVQHAMVAATAVLIALTAWRLTSNRAAALLAGLMAACSLQLITYANLIMTEAPYTLALVASVCFLVSYHQTGMRRSLALASLLAGVAYLFRPIGMSVVAVCVMAVLHRIWREHASTPRRLALRRAAVGCVLAVAPAFAVTMPGMIQNRLIHGGDLSSRCANLALYFRILYMDKLDSQRSPSLADIRSVVNDAIARGALPDNADFRLWGAVWKAYQSVRGVGLADSSKIMGQAARDLIREHPYSTLDKTIRYSLWMVLVPDGFYRFHPGGAPGVRNSAGECVRDPSADILASNTYEPMLYHWTGPYRHYLTLRSDATALTPLWRGIARWFYRHIEKGPSILGLGDSPYEAFGWLCLIGVGASLFSRNRSTWLLVVGVMALQVVVSAFLAGPTPRYAVPVRPLLALFPPLVVLAPVHVVRRLAFARAAACPAPPTQPTIAALPTEA